MKKLLTLLALTQILFAREIIHSSISTYYENKTFENSVQKESGVVYGVGADLHLDDWAVKATYEYAYTNTKQPPLSKDLEVDKLFLRVLYSIDESLVLNINYINILNDNIAITDGGKSFGVGATYKLNKALGANITIYHTNYDDFNVNQGDLRVDYKMKISKIKMKLSSITKYIAIDEKNVNRFTRFSLKDYLTSAIKLHLHYDSYHLGVGAYLGKRAFAIMNDGFKIQHHAMEFDKTYAIGVGKNIGNFVLRGQYIYQRAVELPTPKKEDVGVDNFRVIANYRF